jgi:hypothetical protein
MRPFCQLTRSHRSEQSADLDPIDRSHLLTPFAYSFRQSKGIGGSYSFSELFVQVAQVHVSTLVGAIAIRTRERHYTILGKRDVVNLTGEGEDLDRADCNAFGDEVNDAERSPIEAISCTQLHESFVIVPFEFGLLRSGRVSDEVHQQLDIRSRSIKVDSVGVFVGVRRLNLEHTAKHRAFY